ncbi:MAG: ribosome small subunit-dependent GTPase A [Flavobacteriia bacterium]|nr:ribosome small subunit-dependent GTPase A [Flavobacteriia bacterium]OJX36183.1 MAG: ribosome small subunit-dependent GTPase A [Flavobacteriia bacterium 40-80]
MTAIGKVLKSTGKWYLVEMENGSVINCRIRGKFKLDGLKTTNPVAVGDIVDVDEAEDNEGNRVITKIHERQNYIVRKSTNLSKQMQILAANIDRAYLLVTIHSPVTHLAFIDRFLVSAESFRIPTTILINKADLLSEEDNEYADALIYLYESIGYPCFKISAENNQNIEFLKEEINGKQVMISGHSGVGKSTLVNAIDPDLNLKTGEISKAHAQGQHTTTFAEMHQLASGGYIIDTPGIRAFGIVDLEKEHIAHYFPEMRELLGECRFHNCKHLNEPQCAVKEAVENGSISESRYQTYLQLMEEDPNDVYRRNIYGL